MNFLYKREVIDYDFFNINAKSTLLFLHGWGGDKNSFVSSINLLKSKFDILTLTMPTIKETYEVWLLSDYVDLIKNILSLHNVKSVIIVCHSFGFRVACLLNGIVDIEKIVITGGAGLKKINMIKRIEHQNNIILLKHKRFSYLYNKIASADYKSLPDNNKQTFKNVVNTINNNLIIFSCPMLLFWGKRDTATPIWIANKIYKKNKNINKIHKKYLKNNEKLVKINRNLKFFNKNRKNFYKKTNVKYKISKDNHIKLIITKSDHFAYIKLSSLFNNELLMFLKEWYAFAFIYEYV